MALNFRFREFLVRKIWQVVFGLILIGIIWDIQNYLNLSFCFYVIAETKDVLGCLGCMLLRIFKFWYVYFSCYHFMLSGNFQGSWIRHFGPGRFFFLGGGGWGRRGGLSEALGIFFLEGGVDFCPHSIIAIPWNFYFLEDLLRTWLSFPCYILISSVKIASWNYLQSQARSRKTSNFSLFPATEAISIKSTRLQ